MSDSESEKKSAQLEPKLHSMKIEEGSSVGEGADASRVKVEDRQERTLTPALNILTLPKPKSRSATQSPRKQLSPASSPSETQEHEQVVGGDMTLKMSPGKAPKLSRTASQKIVPKSPQLFLDLPDATEEARGTFQTLPACTYAAKHLGTTEPALECDCAEEWGM